MSDREPTRPRPRRRGRQADHRDPPVPHGDHPGGERHRRPGGDEPLRRGSPLARLPAADDVADRDVDREGLLEHPHEAFAAYRAAGVEQVVCEEKHMGRGPSSWSAANIGRRAPLRHRRPQPAERSSPGPAVRSSPMPRPRRPSSTRSAPRIDRPGSGTSSRPTGSCSTASCCPGRPRPKSCSAASTRRSVPRPRRLRSSRTSGLERRSGPGRRCRRARRARPANESAMVDGFVAAYRQYCWPVERRRRPEARPVPDPGRRGRRPRPQGPPLAPRDPRSAV